MKRRIPYFKIAAHDEARRRNDTIVTWFSSLNVAKDWANIALASPDHWRDGVAPPGQLYWQQTVSVDNEQAGTTTTTKVAEAAYDLLQQNLPFPPLE